MDGAEEAKLTVMIIVFEEFFGAGEIFESGLGKSCSDFCLLFRREKPIDLYGFTCLDSLLEVSINRTAYQATLRGDVFDRKAALK